MSISEFTLSWPSSPSPNLLNGGLQVHLYTPSITTSKCISMVSLLASPDRRPSMLEYRLQPDSSATTLVSVWNTRVFRTALTALTEPRTLWRRIARCPSPRRRVALHSRAPGSAGDKPGSVWERRRQTWERLGAPRITVEHSGKNNIFFGNAAGAPGTHSYY